MAGAFILKLYQTTVILAGLAIKLYQTGLRGQKIV
jgi:hypothetical protein